MGIKTPDVSPYPDEPITVRSHDIVELFEDQVFDDSVTSVVSRRLRVRDFRHFNLYLSLDSTSTPTNLEIQVRFHNPNTGKPHVYRQGMFGQMLYEDTAIADGVDECFSGPVAGREFSVRIVATGTSGSAKFTASVAVEFYN